MPRAGLTEIEAYVRGVKSRAAKPAHAAFAGRASKPVHLSPAALVVWKRVSKLLGARGTETPGDFAALAVFCECYCRWVQAKTELGTALMIEDVVLDSNGAAYTKKKLNPLLKVVEAAEKNVLILARELGLTPLLREKVRPAKQAEEVEHKPDTVGDMLRGQHD